MIFLQIRTVAKNERITFYVFIKSGSDGIRAGVKTVLGLTSGLLFHTLLLVLIMRAFG